MKKIWICGSTLALACLVGCGSQATTTEAPADASQAVEDEPQPVATDDQPSDRDQAVAEPEPDREVARVGVGQKGSNYGGGVITEPASQYWKVKERIVFNIQIPKAMQLYKVNNGSAPKTHEEFMEKIIKPNRIVLPELPRGRSYVYDPKTEQLMIQRPQ